MNSFKRLRSVISYKGGKYKELPHIFKNEPDDIDTFVDVFGGGGVCSLNYCKRGYAIHYNDLFEPLIQMFNALADKDSAQTLQTRLKSITTGPDIHDKICAGDLGVLERFFYISRCTLECDPHRTKSFTPRYKPKTTELKELMPKTLNLVDYVDNVSKWKITQKDFMEVMNEHKHDPGAFLYCDPPYVSKTVKQYTVSFTIDDLMKIYNFMKDPDTKCRVMLNVDYTGWTRETFDDMVKTCYPVTYGCKSSMDIYQKYHLIVCNYA